MIQPFLILSTRSCVLYAKKVVAELNALPDRILFPHSIDYTEELEVLEFADGEIEVILKNSVRGKTVFLFTTCSHNPHNITTEKCKIELYHTIDVLKRSHAKEIIVFEPFISSSRSDRTTRRNSVGIWIHYKTLTALGADHIITYQLHSDKSKTVFDPCLCSIDDVPAIALLQKYLCDSTIKSLETISKEVRENWLFCSVDAGGEKLAKRFALSFGTQLVVAHKQRSYTEANTIENINILSAVPIAKKKIWIVDDMIDTAGSVYGLVKELASHDCAEINILIVHPIFSSPACKRLAELKKLGILSRLVVCDTVSCTNILKELPFIEVIQSTLLSAQIVLNISQDRPMAPIIDAFSPLDYLS